jgi:hypothetical protein
MAKVNFRHEKRQKEIARKQRQDERMLRRGERRAAEEAAAAQANAPPKPAGDST